MDSLRMHRCVERWQGGDRAAADELLRAFGARLEHLARKMLRTFPNVRESAETGDVLQGSLIRLLCTLQQIQPASTRHLLNLAAVHVRRELLDLARRSASRHEVQVRSGDESADGQAGGLALAPARFADSPEDLELWCRFHGMVDRLPAEEREVIGLTFYHGWTQGQIAELLQVDQRTVRRRWQSGCLELNRLVGGQLPPL